MNKIERFETRNCGIELLRIVLMIFIIEGHYLAHTGIRESVPFLSVSWCVIWLLQSITVSAVDGFVFITGFYQKATNLNLKKVLTLWGKVFFYSVSISAIAITLGNKTSISEIVKSLMPIAFSRYWFFTVYVFLYLLAPFFNTAMEHMTKKQYIATVAVLLTFAVLKPTFLPIAPQYDPTEGMGIVSFIAIYVWGGYCRRYITDIKHKKAMLIIAMALVFSSKITIEIMNRQIGWSFGSGILYHYNTVFQITISTMLFYCFKNIRISEKFESWIAKLSITVFGVYLIHEHPFVRNSLWQYMFGISVITKWSEIQFLSSLIWIPLSVYAVSASIDLIRRCAGEKLFNNGVALKLNGYIEQLQNRITDIR